MNTEEHRDVRRSSLMIRLGSNTPKKSASASLKGISVKRIAELFKATPIEFRIDETDPGLKDNEKVIADSFQKKRAMMSNDSSQSSGCMTQDNSHRRMALASSSSFRGNPIRVKRKNISLGKQFSEPRISTDWKATDIIEPAGDDKLTVDHLVRGSLFSKRQNAFNLVDKHKMFFALPKKGDNSLMRSSIKTKDSTKGNSKPVISSVSIPSSTLNLLPKDASLKLQNLRQLYLSKVSKGPRLSNEPPMLSPAQQMIANRNKAEASTHSSRVSVKASVGSSLSKISKQPLNFQIQFNTQAKDSQASSFVFSHLQSRPSLISATRETISKRIKISDRLSLLKTKEVKEITFAPQNTEKFIGNLMDEVQLLGELTYKVSGLGGFQINEKLKNFNVEKLVDKDDRAIQSVFSRGNTSSRFICQRNIVNKELNREDNMLVMNLNGNNSKLNFQKSTNEINMIKKLSQKSVKEFPRPDMVNIENTFYVEEVKDWFAEQEPSILSEIIEEPLFVKMSEKLLSKRVSKPFMNEKDFHREIVKMIFDKNLAKLKYALNSLDDISLLDKRDIRGLTPLILTVKLAYTDQDLYFQILLALLEAGADPRAKDNDGWTALEEAVSHSNVKYCSLLFDYVSAYKLRSMSENQQVIASSLAHLPDYEVQIKWEFDSSIIPLVSKLGPSDTFRIWKVGNRVRLDSTIAGYKNLTTKRRPILDHAESGYILDNPLKIYCLSHTKTAFYDPLADVDLDEKKAIINDLLNSSPVQGRFELKKYTIEESKSLFGNLQNREIAGYDCQKHNVNLDFEYLINKKNTFRISSSHSSYINPEADIIVDQGNNREKLRFKVNDKDIVISTKERQVKNQNLTVFLAKNHPFSFGVVSALLRMYFL